MKDSILAKIVTQTRKDLESRRGKRVLPPGPPPRHFAAQLRQPGLRLIAEIKPKSPSAGVLQTNPNIPAIAAVYQKHADCISVLCDKPFFGGGYDLLARVRPLVNLPILAKDFIVDPYQIEEARSAGADAVLLMMSVLEAEEAQELLQMVRRLGMEALVETHDEAEIEKAQSIGASIIGVNARDLSTLKIDLQRANQLMKHLPANCLKVAESGLYAKADIDLIRDQADACLIGSSFMKAANPAQKMEELGFRGTHED